MSINHGSCLGARRRLHNLETAMDAKLRSRLDPSGRTRVRVPLDRHILAYRQYLADRGNVAGHARSCEAAVAHLSMSMKGAKKCQVKDGSWLPLAKRLLGPAGKSGPPRLNSRARSRG